MVGSTAASLPSPHRDCPTEILDGDVVPPPPSSHAEAVVSPSLPSSIGAVVSSPSTSARAPATLPRPFLPSKNKGHASKNKGHASTEEVAAATALCSLGPLTQDRHQGCGVSGEKQRLPKSPPKKRLSSPLVVPVVRSPGVNVVLSQASPRLGVKRSSPTLPQIPRLSRRAKRRKLKSEIWNDFDPVYDGNKLKEAHCMHCKRVFVVTREAGTSQCIRHLLVCEERAKINEFLDSVKSAMPQQDPNSLEKWNYDPDRAHWELMRMIVVHELPFSIVEYDGFRRFVRSLNPTFEVVSRTTIRLDCLMLFHEQRTKLREAIQNLTSRVSLTTDIWTSSQLVSYMCITCHFVSENWKLQKRVIWFSEAQTPHNGTNLFNIMLECMQYWGLPKKIFSITLDNASNNNSCVRYIKSNLLGKNLLPCKGDLLHGRCASHVINLIVQDGLEITCKAE